MRECETWHPCMNLVVLVATQVATPAPDLGPICPVVKALSATATHGRPLDLPPRSKPMRLKSRMREFCTSGSLGGRAGNRSGLPDTVSIAPFLAPF
jgi:hypothetical protein